MLMPAQPYPEYAVEEPTEQNTERNEEDPARNRVWREKAIECLQSRVVRIIESNEKRHPCATGDEHGRESREERHPDTDT